IAVTPRGSEQATDTVANGWEGILRTDAREISASIDDDVGIRGAAKAASIVGARLDESGIRPASSGYARPGGRPVIGYARDRACDARKNGRKYGVGAIGAGHINYARHWIGRGTNDGVAGGLDMQCALVSAPGIACIGDGCIVCQYSGRSADR